MLKSYGTQGIRYTSSDRAKSQIYIDALPLLTAQRAELLDHKVLVAQICGLERRVSRGGRESVDRGYSGHDDL